MNLRDLTYLLALAEHRHFGRAAEASFVSQPTLSTQIKKLEEELGVALVERTPRKALLTETGLEIARHARAIQAEIQEIKSIAQRNRDPESGTVKLGIFPTLGPYLLPHVIPRLRRELPRLELLLIEDKTEVILKRLREGSLDLGILALPVHEDSLHAEFLFEEPFVLAVPESHHLAASDTALPLDALTRESLLLLEDGHCLRDQALEVCQLAGAGEKPGFRATSLETLRQMVAANVGITLLPALAVAPPIVPTPHIRLRAFAEPAPSRRLAMVWRKRSSTTELFTRLARIFAELPPALLSPRQACSTQDPPATA
ncbi:LysR substrate-binding domain-containing protein [Frateuria aurantia]|uniref:Transcriptional regulator n=1 Tax=Frateuria aurantia (strain ATCC 33424 / DSM 6220 / KCTC 2777 / LMG 1558 / NBRC 3245 / NCIMB 13370) TaxID=767434 RepID=H8L6M6_FRAAD|nr:LysR substrate-binding domain-containing protein [Frateuria aurantia]AFC86842.1 transcriptional regulator [Frateuria aurantia DSM 6220]